jgi:hypothetical protein
MSWPIGYSEPHVAYHTGDDGVVYASGVQVTSQHGWIDVPSPPAAITRGAPPVIAIRIRVVPDAEGRPFLYAEDVQVGARRYKGVFGLLTSEGDFWATRLSDAIHAEIARRVQHATHAPPVIPRSTRSGLRSPDARDAYDTLTERPQSCDVGSAYRGSRGWARWSRTDP